MFAVRSSMELFLVRVKNMEERSLEKNIDNELDIVHRRLSINQSALVNNTGSILLHDNARPYATMQTSKQLRQLGYEVLLIRLEHQTFVHRLLQYCNRYQITEYEFDPRLGYISR